MEIHYRKSEKGLILTGCYGVDGIILLPDEIDGTPIVEIAPYAFSESKEMEDDLVYISEDSVFMENHRRLKTTDVEEIRLPFGVREIGKYAFYRCRNLKKLILSDAILDIGGGARLDAGGFRKWKSILKKVNVLRLSPFLMKSDSRCMQGCI